MANILEQIVADKRIEVEQAKKAVPIEKLYEATDSLERCRNFYKAITKRNQRGINVIAEVKKASPSAGIIREDFDPVAVARSYQSCGADAISVLTDQKYFQGCLEYLTAVKAAVDIPVLRKDFIVDPYQVYEARAAGADAILLIAEVLNLSELIDLMLLAGRLTMTCLVEVHSLEMLLSIKDMIEINARGFTLVGVNNRDLTDMTIDTGTTSRLAGFVDNRRSLVAESGIRTRQDVLKMINVGVGGILIGQTLCESPDIETKFRELFG